MEAKPAVHLCTFLSHSNLFYSNHKVVHRIKLFMQIDNNNTR